MQEIKGLVFLIVVLCYNGLAVVLHAPTGFQGLIPADLEELNHNFTEKQEAVLYNAILLLGEGQGKAVAYLKAHDPEMAKLASSAFTNVEKKLEKMNSESIKFIGQVCHNLVAELGFKLMEYLRISPGRSQLDKNGNSPVPKEIHEISVVGSWSQLSPKTKAELQDAFPSITKTLKSLFTDLNQSIGHFRRSV